MISLSVNAYNDKLDDIVNKYKSNTYIDSCKDINDKDHRFKISDIIRTSK